MAKLRFTGRSGDGKRLLLVDESGQEHSLAIDARLRRALSGAPESNGQLEIPMESSLRPRDIQARIRAGETPESVAHAAGTSVEKIMPFAAPVMAERAHVAQRAQLASVRRRSGESGARTLGEAVSAHLRSHNVDPTAVEWDAWRREDGRWTLTAMYDVGGRAGTGTCSPDPRGSYVPADADEARWLVGDASPSATTTETAAEAADDLAAARQRRLSAVGEEPAFGDDAIEMVSDGDSGSESPAGFYAESATETTMELGETPLGTEQPHLDDETADHPAGDHPADDPVDPSGGPTADEPEAEAPEPRRPAKKRGRASVPSWDEIMFGGGKND